MAEQERIVGTLVLVADEGDGPATRRAVAEQVASVHQGPVVVLPHNWRIIDPKRLRAYLDHTELETAPRLVQEYKMGGDDNG